MGKGRKPLPQEVKDLKKTTKACRVNNDRPESSLLQKTPPRSLSREAKKYWKDLIKKIGDSGILQQTDAKAVADYCEICAQLDEVSQKVTSTGFMYIAADGTPKINPYFQIQDKLRKQIKHYFSEFGFTPSSRERVRVKKEGEEDPDDDDFDY